MNMAYHPDGGLDIVASAERITGATDAFDDLAEFVGHVFNLDLAGIQDILQWDILVGICFDLCPPLLFFFVDAIKRFFCRLFELQGGGKAIHPALVYPFLIISILNTQRGQQQRYSVEMDRSRHGRRNKL